MPTYKLLPWLMLLVGALAHGEAISRKGAPSPEGLGAKEDAVQLDEEVTVETCYKIPLHVPKLQQTHRALFPLPEVGKRKDVGSEVFYRESVVKLCQYPDEVTFKQFQSVRERLSRAQSQ